MPPVYDVDDVENVDDSDSEAQPVKVPRKSAAPRKAVQRAKGRTGRSAFVDPICKDHPDWEDENGEISHADGVVIHCAKFGHLPGGGRGAFQPGLLQSFKNTSAEFVKPVLLFGLLCGAFLILGHFLGGGIGSHVLRPANNVCQSTGGVPASSGRSSHVPTPVHSGSTNCRPNGGTNFLHVGPAVTPKAKP